MKNIEKYNEVFLKTFYIKEDELKDLKYQDISAWDSVGHMSLMVELEEAFGIMMETEDILDFSSYIKGFEILAKYNVEF